MGKKRRNEKTEDETRRKIRRLQDRLNNMPDRTSSDENSIDTPQQLDLSPQSEFQTLADIEEVPVTSPYPTSPCGDFAHIDSPQPTSSATVAPAPLASDITADATQTEELDDDILQLLGDAPKNDTPKGPPIHKDIASRWQDILARGLPKELKERLLKDYLVPSNCDLLLPPTLNLEIKAALQENMVKRDSSLMHKQRQLGVALAALANVTEMVISNEMSQQKILKPLSDACRILCDSHFNETKTRRNFVISSINANMKNALIESQRNDYLFGENVTEKLKAAKTIQQLGEALKHSQREKLNKSNTTGPKFTGRLNFTPQHRKTDNKLGEVKRTSRYPPRIAAPAAASRTSRRSPPHKTASRRK